MFTKINTKNKISSKKQKIKYINEKNYKHKLYINFPAFNKNLKSQQFEGLFQRPLTFLGSKKMKQLKQKYKLVSFLNSYK